MIAATPNTIRSPKSPGFDITPLTRALVTVAGTGMSMICLIAIFRGLTGIAPAHSNIRHLAIALHVSTVIPAVPLGAYLLLARKGTPRHKQLGKIWVALMVMTAASAIFIKTSGSFSFSHIFVPLTLMGSWKVIATARAGQLQEHKRQIIGLYLAALMIPGIFAFALPGRLMNVWLLG